MIKLATMLIVITTAGCTIQTNSPYDGKVMCLAKQSYRITRSMVQNDNSVKLVMVRDVASDDICSK